MVQWLENLVIARCSQQRERSEYTGENFPIFVSLDLNEYRNTFKIHRQKTIPGTREVAAAFSE